MMKDTVYFGKTLALIALLTVESTILTKKLFEYVVAHDYFTPRIDIAITITLLLLLICYTYTLTVGAWGKWEQFFVVPFPISLGMFLGLFWFNSTYAILLAVTSYIIVSYEVFIATHMSKMLIYFEPRTILRFSTRGILVSYALLAAVLVFLQSVDAPTKFNISSLVNDVVQTQMQVSTLPRNEALSVINNNLVAFDLDLQETVKREVDRVVEPYRHFIPPLIAVLVFAIVRFFGGIAHGIFNLTVPGVFWMAKKTGLFHVRYIDVKKEVLTFSPQQEIKEKTLQSPQSF